ncbi:MAG: hypothetical protein ONB44_23170 [candidate division KSB1 bacterium]|nr:hypothetical protein [candidate division KSB1 bacterium]MDZ7305042.1 hypothetical protein [candidate division KSB1 bacterium]MDZ7312894.1 hypothetical protein [candidate division KSB1 bacterium]
MNSLSCIFKSSVLVFVVVVLVHTQSSQAQGDLPEQKSAAAVMDSLRNQQLENEYATGITALQARNWAGAILSFEKILEINRDFRDARKRLATAQKGLSRESPETMVAQYYAEGISAISSRDLERSWRALNRVRKLNPNYRDVASLLTQVESTLRIKAEPVQSLAPSLAVPVNVDSLYQSGLAALEQHDWLQAVISFEKIQVLQPNYRDVLDRLAHARANLTAGKKSGGQGQTRVSDRLYFYVGGALTAFVMLPLLGFIAFSPGLRARIHLMRGNYLAAAQIYEGMLAHRPSKTKLYPLLANIYLLLGRDDEAALKVYKTVLQLNLAARHRDEISTIVAQKYLTEGRTDSDAIEVLENALKAERRRLAHVEQPRRV